MLLRTGRIEEASAMIQKAHELDPYSPIITINLGVVPMARGQFEEALGYFAKSVELDPMFAVGYEWEGIANYRLKNYSEAQAQLEKGVELSGRSSECISSLGYFYAKRGMKEKALKLLKENELRYHEGTGSASQPRQNIYRPRRQRKNHCIAPAGCHRSQYLDRKPLDRRRVG